MSALPVAAASAACVCVSVYGRSIDIISEQTRVRLSPVIESIRVRGNRMRRARASECVTSISSQSFKVRCAVCNIVVVAVTEEFHYRMCSATAIA